MDEKFGVVLVAGLTVFGLVFIYDATTDGISSDIGDEEVFYEKSFGTIGQEEHDHRVIELGDFNVGEGRADVLGFEQDRARINDRFLRRNQRLTFDYNATQPRDGTLEFEVLGRDGPGSVYVKVNGEKVFDEHLISTSNPTVEIPEQNLRHGINNFEVGVNKDGIITGSEYVLEDAELRVSDRTFSDHKDSFRVYSFEIEDFVEADLTFDIDEAIREENLRITVNGNEIYNRRQARTSDEEASISLDYLQSGSNRIEFSTSRPAEYYLENSDIVIRSLEAIVAEEVDETFELNSEQLSYANTGGTQEYITFEYRSLLPTPRDLQIDINDETLDISPERGLNQYEIPEETLEEENSLRITSEGAYVLENLQIKSVRGN